MADDNNNAGIPMADFDADKLNERLEQLNREQLTQLEWLTEKVLRDMQGDRPEPKRADEARSVSNDAAIKVIPPTLDSRRGARR